MDREEKQIKKYGEFMNEKYKLIISDESQSDFNSEEWILKFDISNIWKQYDNKKINTPYFLQQYKKYILDKKDSILEKIGEECWTKIEKVLEDFDTYDQESVYKNLDKMYDIGDKYGIKIETN